jgi:hypothetical protein
VDADGGDSHALRGSCFADDPIRHNQITVNSASFTAFSQTFTRASDGNEQLLIAYKDTSNNAFDLDVRNVRIHPGAADLGADVGAGHMMYGLTDDDTSNPSFSGGVVKERGGLALLSEPTAITDWSAWFAFKQENENIGSTIVPYVVSSVDFQKIAFGPQDNNLSVRATGGEVKSDFANIKNRGWCVCLARVQNGRQELLVNGILVASGTRTVTAHTTPALAQMRIHEFSIDSTLMSGATTLGQFQKGGFVTRYMTDDEVTATTVRARTDLAAAGFTLGTWDTGLIALGDSITIDSTTVGTGGTGSYAWRALTTDTTLTGVVVAQASVGVEGAITQATLALPSIRAAAAAGNPVIVSALIGVNDSLVSTDPAAWYDRWCDLADLIRGAGGKFLAMTISPKNDNAHNTGAATIDTLMLGDPTKYDAIVNLRDLPMGQFSAPFGTTYYTDGVHYKGAAYDELTPEFEDKISDIRATL